MEMEYLAEHLLGHNVKVQGHWGKCENGFYFGAYLREQCIHLRKTKTSMNAIPRYTFRPMQCSSENA